MKVFISVDIEGITGVSHWDETTLESKFLKQMTRETAAACEGANRAGARQILVKDAHSSGRNIDPNGLPLNAKIHRSWSMGPLSMMEGLDESFDAVMFVGYHSGAFVDGNPLAHTFSNSKFQFIKVNGEYASEFDINSMMANYFDVPVVFLSGDKSLCERAKSVYPDIHTVDVMEGLGDSTISIHPEVAIERIIENSEQSFTEIDKISCELPAEFIIEIQYKEAKFAHRASFYPDVEKIDPKTVKYVTNDFMDFLKMLMFVKI